jgi:type I restriction enzyme, R subunit
MSKLGTEKSAVQDPLIKYAREIGWEYLTSEEAERLRGGTTGLIFRGVFTNQLLKLNSEFIDNQHIEELIKRIERIPAKKEGNLEAWEYLKGLKTIFLPKEKRERNVKIIDEDPKNNIYQITDEFSYTNGINTNRYDVVFLINGIPVFFVETKSVAKFIGKRINRESIITDALDQIRRYHLETPEAMTLFQVYTTTNIIHFLYSATWRLDAKSIFNWKTEVSADTFETMVKTFFDKRKLTQMLLHFIMFTRQDDELIKVILRPHQMRAVDKIVTRAASSNKHGLIWHTQGSGKTYTMIVAAQRILENPMFQNPTIIMLVDRNELETQLFGNLSSVGIERVQVAQNKSHLRDLLQSDTRGLIVSMIHKFEGMPKDVNLGKNIFVLVDEAHRTTGGDLGNYLMGALPNAYYLGFTGTPIDKTFHGKGTFVVFGKDDPPHGYLDKYGIAESIEDGTTVKLHYTLAPNELRPDKETLEKEFLSLAEAEGISDVDELNKVLDRAVTLKNMLKNKERVGKVAKYIVDHYKDYVEPLGYKAFLVAVDREACVFYKKELDKYLPKEYSEIVYSPFYGDVGDLKSYHLTEEQEKRIRKAFRNPEKLPKILIVTEKLLTGFDAPILYCMYLDKPMRDHVLLQAIARVNRPYEDEQGIKKPCGFVLDFVGIFDKLEKALAFDSSDITGVIKDIEVLKEHFKELIQVAREKYLALITGKTSDKAVETVLEQFRDEEKRQELYEFFQEISAIYEIISPDAFLRPYIEDFDTLARIFKIVREAYESGITLDREFARKTAKLVQEHTYSGEIKPTIDIVEINGETLKRIEESRASDTEKIFNLLRSIGNVVNKDSVANPFLQSIGEKAELISLLYKERQKDTKETLEELKKVIDEINQAKKEQAESYLKPEGFSARFLMKDAKIANWDEKAKNIQDIFDTYPHWKTSEEYERNLKQEILRIFTVSKIEPKKAVELTNKLIKILKGAK